MKALSFVFLGCFFAFSVATAQADHKLDDQTIQTDKTIRAQIIKPFIAAADQQNQEPDWKVLRTTIVTQYSDAYADRTITKARLITTMARTGLSSPARWSSTRTTTSTVTAFRS